MDKKSRGRKTHLWKEAGCQVGVCDLVVFFESLDECRLVELSEREKHVEQSVELLVCFNKTLGVLLQGWDIVALPSSDLVYLQPVQVSASKFRLASISLPDDGESELSLSWRRMLCIVAKQLQVQLPSDFESNL